MSSIIEARQFKMPSTTLNESLNTDSSPATGKDRSLAAAKEAKESTEKSLNGKERNDKKSKPGLTFAAQDKLPRLPIPDLEATLKRYNDSLAPLQTSREQQETQAASKDFLEHDGKELQDKLKKYATGKSSYIEQFWYDSYLNYDNPVVLNLNPFFLLEDDPTPARNNQVTRAASLVISALCFVRAVRKEELPPDTLRGQPLDMFQYSRMFGTARVPTENGCIIGQDSDAKHVVVLCRGQFYWFDVLDANNDLIMTEKDVAINLQVIVEDAELTPIHEAAKGAIGVLSTENRKTWSGLRDVLSREEGSNNSEGLNIVDSALFIVCLDWAEPKQISQLCGNMLCGTSEIVKGVQVGTCTNRWYDKLQIIVCQNGTAGINFEHTGVDGHTVLRFASDVYTDTILRFARSINGQAPVLWTSTSPDPSKRSPESFGDVSTTPHKLEWDMIPELSIALRFAETRLADLIQQNEFQTLDFSGYGKNFITSMGFSPDAFVQMAFQAAYYGLYGRLENTYEPAMTKMYLHGRTEAIRSVTPESAEFVKTFWADNPAQKKVDALRKAAQKHTKITKECSQAQGFDRHLYALYCVWQRQLNEDGENLESSSSAGFSSNGYSSPNDPSDQGGAKLREQSSSPNGVSQSPTGMIHTMPAFFADSGWERMNNTILSTSNCGNPSLHHFGFGPTSGEGFGIGYIIKDESISICASSKHRQTKRFVDSIESYLNEIRKNLKATASKDAGGGKSSRARELDDVRGKDGRLKSRGRVIKSDNKDAEVQTPTTQEDEDSDQEGCKCSLALLLSLQMRGCYVLILTSNFYLDGFFDAGMLKQALKSNQQARRESVVEVQKRRNVGKRLAVSEY